MTPSLHQDKKKPSKIRSKIQTYVDCTKIGRNKINVVTNKTFKTKSVPILLIFFVKKRVINELCAHHCVHS